MHRGFRNMPFNMWTGWFIPIILIVIIIITVYMLVNNKKKDSRDTNKSALDILDERFAKGEIDEEEYLKKKDYINNIK